MNKAIFKAGGCLLVALVLFLMVGSAKPVEAGVGCGKMGSWIETTETCSVFERNCIVVCAY